MPTYTINGKKITTDVALTEDQIDEIAFETSFQGTPKPSLSSEVSTFIDESLQPNKPEPFDLATSAKRVGTSAAVGAGLGSILPGLGTGAGAVSGALSGIAGEYGRNIGASDAATFGLEMLGGEAPVLARAGAKTIGNVLSPASYSGSRFARLFETDKLRQDSIDQVRKNYFGKIGFDLDIIPQNTEAYQIATKQALGIPETNPNAVSSILRQNYYNDVRGLAGVNTTTEQVPTSALSFKVLKIPTKTVTKTERTGFITSPEHKELIDKLAVLSKTNRLPKSESTALNNILKLEVDKDPNVRKLFVEELTNYIQNGGAFLVSKIDGKPQTAQKINPNVQEALRETFDKYLERNLGSKRFGELKAVERQEFEAKARDLIPNIISSGGTLPREELEFILSNAKNSPVVRREFSQALMQRLSDPSLDTSAKLLSEFRKYNKDLVNIGVFDRKGLTGFYTKLKKFDKNVDKKVIQNLIMTTLATPVITTEASEVSSGIFPKPLAAFSL
jgi:hypothetical protein